MRGNPLQQRESVAAGAARAVSLTPTALLTALGIGAIALLSGAAWAVILVLFFATATAVSRFRAATKSARAGALLEKTGPRDPTQVLANGGAFAAAVAAFAITGQATWAAFAVGALAAASADTWATELGLLSRRPPRSLITGKTVQPGTSGGVTLAGTVAGLAGALVVTIAASAFDVGAAPIAVFIGGVAGMLIDSVLGATLQERRWCTACGCRTERRTHSCGAATRRLGGVRGMNNDAVNAVTTIAGGSVAAIVARVIA